MRTFAIAFVAGALWLQQQAELPRIGWGGVAAAALLALTLLRHDRTRLRFAICLAAGACAGFGWAAWRAELRMADALPHAAEGIDVEVVGVIAGLPRIDERGARFLLDVEAAASAVPRKILLSWYRPRGERAPVLAAGERWRMSVRLKRPRGALNPHTFDFEAWALERGIRATGYVREPHVARRLEERVAAWPHSLHRWRGDVREAMRAHLGEARLAGVLVALAIGDQDSIGAADWETFWRTGVGHLMSISGLHITMLAALGYALAFFAWVRIPPLALYVPARKAAVVAGTLVALAYCLATGYAVPAQRTFLMVLVVALCVLADRHGSPSRVLAFAALAVVAFDPWAVLASGFWLSFGAVAAIFYAMALRTGRRGRLRAAALEQAAVTLLMLPLLVAMFQQFALVSPLANALAIPVVSLVVVPLTLTGAFGAATLPLDAAHAVMLLLMEALEAMAQWPFANLENHAPAAWTVALALVGCAWLLAPRGVPLRSCGAVWIAPLFLVAPERPATGEAWLDVLDVGSGLALVVRTARHALAYDAGPTWNAEADSGSRIVVPFLRGEGIARLDALVVSHADDDHAGGAPSVAALRSPRWLLSPLAPEHGLHERVPASVRCTAGQEWTWDEVRFQVLHPAREAYLPEPSARRRAARKENDRSCVLLVRAGAAGALLTGDIEARSEAEMLARGRELLAADLLVVPHHGSRSSSTAAFVDAVSPVVAVVSAAHRSRFGHPHESVVQRYRERGAELRETAREGALRVVLPAHSAQRTTVRALVPRVRYWSDRRPP